MESWVWVSFGGRDAETTASPPSFPRGGGLMTPRHFQLRILNLYLSLGPKIRRNWEFFACQTAVLEDG